ncbi:hypothetical protein B0H17DRAFT_560803 [Mycena rosella]|uniref:F-box domain-containing protein n=1 Tax=Mycena rosella TaxID=1033263 RepID=A0AAD7BPC0_MYCRO|nr:hypothetical protein B0H17DRAFT_560803 [Mycena rosella]
MTSCEDDSFVRLPDSSVRYIFQFFEDAELYDFSFTSLRMHKLALSVLLSRRNVPNPLESADIDLGEQTNTLQVLRIALFVVSIKHLSIRFSPGIFPWIAQPYPVLTMDQLQSTAESLEGEMIRVRRLLQKLDSVDEITLILPGSLEWNLRDVNLEHGSTDDFSWSPIISCFQDILGKRCTSFTVRACPFWTAAQTVARPGKASGGLIPQLIRKVLKDGDGTDMCALARWDGAKYRPQKPPRPATIRTGVTTFSINTTLLLFPACAGWTFSVLKHSPLVALHISGLSISRPDWGQVASKIADAVPNLLELNFDDRKIAPDCLMWLLNRLPKLTSLTIGQKMTVYVIHPRIFPAFSAWYIPAFRRLTKLSAHTSYVSLFLMRRNPLPALRSLPLPPTSIYHVTSYHHKSFYNHIPGILRRLRDLNHPLFPLPVTFSLGYRGQDNYLWLSRHIDSTLALDPSTLDSLREITHLVLEEIDCRTDVQCLCRWLGLFPSIREVSWWGPDHQLAERVTLAHLAHEIARACPTIEAIMARGVQYSIPAVSGQSIVIPQFCDLPTEVLLLIFDLLHTELLDLSLLCRRLHFLALPIILARNSINNPCEITSLDIGAMVDSQIVLRALRVALFVPSIKHLVCIFPDPVYIYHHLDNIRRVTRLIIKLMKVEKLSLNFVPNKFRLGDLGNRESYLEHRIWETCYCALSDLLSAVSDKSCTSLAIVGCPATGRPAFATLFPQPPSANITSISNLSLDVDRPPSYSWWIFAALKNSPITSLHLTVTDRTNLEYIANYSFFLTVLSIEGKCALRNKVLKYLAGCPNITTLTLGSDLSGNDPTTNVQLAAGATTLRLDSLVELSAPVDYIHHLSQAFERFPALERLRVLIDNLDGVGWDLTSLIEGVRECYSSSPAITLEIVDPVDRASLAVNSISFLGGKWTHAARHISGLVVRCHPEWFHPGEAGVIDPNVFPLLANWFGAFNSVHSISFRAVGVAPSDSVLAFAESVGRALPSVLIVYWDDRILFKR